jgi:hypothetical protein
LLRFMRMICCFYGLLPPLKLFFNQVTLHLQLIFEIDFTVGR